MKKSVLLTRAAESNEEIKEQLGSENFDFLDCSLIQHSLLPIDIEYINKFSKLLITSNFAAYNTPPAPMLDMPVWVVGGNSAKTLQSKGYKIEYCATSAENLKKNLPEKMHKMMLYLSGDHITVDMPPYVTRKILYNTKYLESLSIKQIVRYKEGIDYIVLYSENCAKTLLKLLIENNLVKYLEKSAIIVISSKVDNIFKHLFKNIVICGASDSMLKYIKKYD